MNFQAQIPGSSRLVKLFNVHSVGGNEEIESKGIIENFGCYTEKIWRRRVFLFLAWLEKKFVKEQR